MALSVVTISPIFGSSVIVLFSLTLSKETFVCLDFPEHPNRKPNDRPIKRKGPMLNKVVYKLKPYLFFCIRILQYLKTIFNT
jgi:hypothetical protein